MRRLEQLDVPWADRAYAFCAEHALASTYIAGWIRDGGLEQRGPTSRGWLLADRDEEIHGLAFLSQIGILMPLALSQVAIDGIVAIARSNPNMIRVLIGETQTVARVWERLQPLGFRARITREQELLTVSRDTFRPVEEALPLTIAARDSLDLVVEASAHMAREEGGDDPQKRNPQLFRTRIEQRVDRGRDFVYVDDGQLVFKTNVSALSPLGGQIEGIYTTPGFRRRQWGRRGSAWITSWVLERSERATLLVNEDNFAAKAMYAQLGYAPAHACRTIFVAP